MYRLFILPLKSLPLKLGAFALAALFILAACGGFTIDLNLPANTDCFANPFVTECDEDEGVDAYRKTVIKNCADNPNRADSDLCIAAEAATNPPSDDENGAAGAVAEVVDNTPKDIEIKPESDKDSLTKTDKEKGETTSLEIVDLCSDPANAGNERCTPAVINCITNPFSGDCEGDNVLGNFVRGAVTVSKTVVLQDKRAEDCRTGRIDRALCQNLSVQKQRCAGAAFSTDAICSAVAYSVCKADAFDPLCGEKEDFQGVYFNERSDTCFEDPNNPHCKGLSGHVAVVCSEYPFDRLCTGNADYDDARANACEADPSVSSDCPVVLVVEPEEEGTEPEVADVCLDNPFGPTCADSSYNNARKDLAKTCAIQAVTGAVTSACDTIITEALPCFINPFDTVCDSNPAVRSYIAQLRSTRVAFCNSNLRIASLCTGAPVAKSVCRIDPFDTVCLGDNDYAGDRLSACRDGSATTGQCSNIIAKVCGNDPFDTLCGSGYNDDRANFCRNSVEPVYRCLKVEDRVCATNPLDSLCSASIYAGARINACRNDQSNPSCRTIIANLCHRDNNPFDSLCGSNYNGIRESVCASNPNSSRCSDTLTRVCGGNPFDSLCRNTQSYLDTRVSICRGNPADGRCGWTIGSICRDDPFDSLCGGGYNNARLTACRNGSTNTQCGNIVAGVCSGNPFDPLCGNGYIGERETACRNGSTNTQCGNVIAGVCSGNPFDPLCGNGYTGERETACRNGSTNTQCGNIVAGVCSGNPFDPLCGSGYTQNRRNACSGNPFATRCGGDVYNDLRVSFCDKVANAGNPACPTPQVTAEVWADSFDEDLAHGATADDTKSQFLIARETDLDTGGVTPFSWDNTNQQGNLNLADATFNGVALGGDATDGVAYFASGVGEEYSYAGILSGTNLGAPLTQRQGTAKWIGSFITELSSPTDFVLNISFGTGDGAGEIEALVQSYGHSVLSDYNIAGEFDDAGVITGTIQLGDFKRDDTPDNPVNRGTIYRTGKLTGLIGEEGTVGAFLIGSWFGGFVARPPSEQELRTVTQTCNDNPFHEHCNIGYESERVALIEHCIIGDNYLNRSRCGAVKKAYPCIKNVFNGCGLPGETLEQQARDNRLEFCRTAGNADNKACTVTSTFKHICKKYPFDARCLDSVDYSRFREKVCRPRGSASRNQCARLAEINCALYPFYSYCDSGYNGARETVCASNPDELRCTDTIVRVCNGNPFNPLCGNSYTQNRRTACTDDPFAPRCTGAVYNDLRASFCEDNAGNHPSCPPSEPAAPQVTAKVWADSFDTPLARTVTADSTKSKFLIGRATDLDGSAVASRTTSNPQLSNRGDSPDFSGNLNLADATFKGVALGGDRADGMAFFVDKPNRVDYSTRGYVGVLSGTNLGAPLTDTEGSAKWVGAFQYHGEDPRDFILNISFGTGTGTGAGKIEALIKDSHSLYDIHIVGEFNDTGVITGTAVSGFFRVNDPDNRGNRNINTTGELTGLIGEEGAVGGFLIRNSYGGFVARPSSGEELRTLEQTCNDNPFDRLCAVGYETQRNTIIEHCIIGGNANDESCSSVNGLPYCINDPFYGLCINLFSEHYQQARDNRVAFCRTAGNADNALCTVTETFAHICTNHPFDAQCRGDNDYRTIRRDACLGDPFATRCAGNAYNDLRVSFCEGKVGTHPACPTPQVTAKVWADSFDTPLATAASRDHTESQFLIGRETDLDTGGAKPYGTHPHYNSALNLADATFNGVALGGDRADGVGFFTMERAKDNGWYSYAGILSGTNLGAPLTQIQGSAKWIGSFQHQSYSPTDFILNVSFGTGAGAGEIEAVVQLYSFTYDTHLKGEFDDAGVITGTARMGSFRTNDPNNRGHVPYASFTSKLTGLIGEEGAVGAVVTSGHYGSFRGFVARPPSAEELRTLEQTCADDPFNKRCTIGYESQRNAIIEHCITGGNANDERCDSANTWYFCINDPFGTNDPFDHECSTLLPQYYEQLQANRLAFCRTAGNADNALCTVETTFAHICTNYPFDAQCRGDNDYRPIRRDACSSDPFATRCAGDAYNDLRVSFCEGKVGNSACPRPQPSPNRVTTADWLASFENELPKSPSGYDFGARFLEGKENGLDTEGITPVIFSKHPELGARVYNLNFDTATFDGQYLNGDAEDGVAFFSGENNSNRIVYYVGILSGTDLGAPVNQTGTAIWNGQIGSTRTWNKKPLDFSLNIDFDGQGQGGSITGFSQLQLTDAGIYSYLDLSGRFDANGVILGKAKKGDFSSTNRNSQIGGYKQTGSLTGLIGEEGAVGAFMFGAYGGGWAGGFVVRPSATFATPETLVNNAQVTTSDWLTSVGQGESSTKYRLLKASKTGLSIANDRTADYHVLTLADATFDGRDLGGDRADGIAFARGESPRQWYSQNIGILSGTDLGAPLTQEQGTVYWEGKMIALGITEIFKDFKLQINFGQGDQAGTISAFVAAEYPDLGHHYRLDGSFDTIGVIKGTTESGMFTTQNTKIPQYWRNSGTLTGLIGEEGAVGAFFSNREGQTSYVGGFVAKPNVTPATTPTTVAVTPVERVTKDIWLRTLDKGVISSDRPDIIERTNFSSGLNIDGEANNGFFFNNRYNGFSEILAGTDLGAPLTQTTGSARWNGLFINGGFSGPGPKSFHSDFVLEITFGSPNGYAGRIDAVVLSAPRNYSGMYLRGVFDDNGVISGRIFYASFLYHRDNATNYGAFQILTGLIGQNGAVGVVDPVPGYPGAGFIASPKAINVVRYTDWKVPYLPNAPRSAAENRFIKITPGGLNVGELKNADGTAAVVNTLNFNSADNIDGGVDFTSGFIDGNKGFFATVLDTTTNLGEPVTLTTGSTIWQGKFKALIGDRIVNKNLDLTVDFENDRISAGVQDTGNYYLSIDGSYNEHGFIEGTTSYGTSSVNSDGSRNLPGTNGNVGILKGLIGQKGAVGAFISEDNAATRSSKNTIGYAGGFVATPPRQ